MEELFSSLSLQGLPQETRLGKAVQISASSDVNQPQFS